MSNETGKLMTHLASSRSVIPSFKIEKKVRFGFLKPL
jgi:hypothetical protein